MIQIETAGNLFRVLSPFAAKDEIKALPGAKWDKALKRWTFPATQSAAHNLRASFPDVDADEAFWEKIEGRAIQPGYRHLLTKPWQHQDRAVRHGLQHDGAMLACAMGTGKSLMCVAIACETAAAVIILAPLAVVRVWPAEFAKHAGKAFRVLPLFKGSIRDRTLQAQQFAELCRLRGERFVIALNYESAWREPFKSWALGQTWDLAVFDEVHRAKAPGGKASHFCAALGDRSKRRLGLTGTPMPHSPLDIYAQFRALDKAVFGTSFTRFRARYAVMGGYSKHQVVGYQNEQELRDRYRSIAFEASADVLDLPEFVDIERTFDLSDHAMRVYRELEADFYAEVERGEVTVANALVKLLRLQQITSGDLHLDDGAVEAIDDAKAEALADTLQDIGADEPVIVVCKFRRDIDRVQAMTEAAGRRFGAVCGGRKDLDGHKMPADVDVMAVQIQSGGTGIDLTRACYCIFYSLGFSLGDYEQMRARIHRPGQDRACTYIHLIAEGTIDRSVQKALAARKNVIETVMKRED